MTSVDCAVRKRKKNRKLRQRPVACTDSVDVHLVVILMQHFKENDKALCLRVTKELTENEAEVTCPRCLKLLSDSNTQEAGHLEDRN